MDLVETVAEGLVRRCEGRLEPDELDQQIGEKVAEVLPTLVLPGFRRGKVPERVVRARFGKELKGETVGKIIEDALKRHLAETGNRPVRTPETNVTGIDAQDGDIEVTIDYECMPEFPEIDFSQIELERPVPKDLESLVDREVALLASALADFEDTEPGYEAVLHDQVTFDLRVLVNGTEREDLRAEGVVQRIDETESSSSLTAGLVGAKAGERRSVTGELPDRLAEDDGETSAEFDCLIKEVRRAVLPEINDVLATRVGMGSLEELKGASRRRLQESYAVRAERIMHQRLLDELDERLDFELPPGLLAGETATVQAALASEANMAGDSVGDVGAADQLEGTVEQSVADRTEAEQQADADAPESDEEIDRIARRRLKLGLFLSEVATTNGLKATDADYDELISSRFRNPEERRAAAEAFRSNPELASRWLGTIIERKSLRFLAELATKSDLEMEPGELEQRLRELDSDDGDEED